MAGIIFSRNLVRKVISLNILNSAVVIIFLLAGSNSGSMAPIIMGEIVDIADPLPQALMLTAIVVGICLTALSLVLIYQLYQRTGSLDIIEVEKIIKEETGSEC